jgi:hypothetical protein
MPAVFIDSMTGELKYQGTSGTPAILSDGTGQVPFLPMSVPYTLLTGVQTADSSVFAGLGAREIDPSAIFSGNSKINLTVEFRALVEATTGVTAEIRLYNLDTGSAVSGSTLTTSSNSPDLLTAVLTVGSAPDLVNGSQNYELQLRISAPGSPGASDRAICKMAEIVFNYS